MKLASIFGKKSTGDDAERLAERHLHQHGLKTIARNYRCRFGEIDLIMQDGETTVFVEVRYRASQNFGGAAASINFAKQRRVIAAAEHYLADLRHAPRCRFDAILMNKLDAGTINWIKDAFGV